MIRINQRHLKTQMSKSSTLVDLAGSEMEEAKNINKSLSALGQVINAPTDSSVKHDSKLTRLLSTSIGGNARTALIVNVSPSVSNSSETLSTLRFGSRAKNIKNKAVINVEKSPEEFKAMLAAAEDKILKLETEMSKASEQDCRREEDERVETLEKELRDEREVITSLEALLLDKDRVLEQRTLELESLRAENKEKELQLEELKLSLIDSERLQVLEFEEPTVVKVDNAGKARVHMNALRQRLTQLVAVHRRLLRQYAAVEMNLEAAKNVLLMKEDRIEALEKENKLLSGTMRIQAERQAKGNQGIIRSVRGGGGRPPAASDTGYFTRIFSNI